MWSKFVVKRNKLYHVTFYEKKLNIVNNIISIIVVYIIFLICIFYDLHEFYYELFELNNYLYFKISIFFSYITLLSVLACLRTFSSTQDRQCGSVKKKPTSKNVDKFSNRAIVLRVISIKVVVDKFGIIRVFL